VTLSDRSSESNQSYLKEVTWGDFTWVDIVQPTKEITKYLIERYNFNPLDIEDALSPRQVSKIEEYPEYLFIIFHLSVFNKLTRISSRKQWSAFVGPNYLITLRPPEFKVGGELFRECELREEAREEYLSQGSGYLLYQILDRAIDRYFKVLDKILDFLEEIEDDVFKEEVEVAPQLSVLRRDIINQRQVMFPTRTLFVELEKKLKPYSKIDLTLYFSDLMDHINKVCNTLDEYTEIIEVFKDSDYLLSAYRANRTIRTLALFLAIILPFLFVVGIYLVLPASPEKSSPQGLGILLGAVIVVMGVVFYLLHRRRLI
jgi:magnesium transporter